MSAPSHPSATPATAGAASDWGGMGERATWRKVSGGCVVWACLRVAVAVGVTMGVAMGVAVAVGVPMGVAVGVAMDVAVGVAMDIAVGVGICS